MNQRPYVETIVISYLAARTSRDVIIKAHQEVTRTWWQKRRKDFELMVSDVAQEEIGAVYRNAGYEPPMICTPEELMGD